jgi:peroxiredoxin
LQKSLTEIEKAGVQVVAISYDSVDVLKQFASKREITFLLLSDKDSKAIDAYKIRNEKANTRIEGVPHPGTILVDKEGIIRAKLGHEGYKERHGSKELIEAAKKLGK